MSSCFMFRGSIPSTLTHSTNPRVEVPKRGVYACTPDWQDAPQHTVHTSYLVFMTPRARGHARQRTCASARSGCCWLVGQLCFNLATSLYRALSDRTHAEVNTSEHIPIGIHFNDGSRLTRLSSKVLRRGGSLKCDGDPT